MCEYVEARSRMRGKKRQFEEFAIFMHKGRQRCGKWTR